MSAATNGPILATNIFSLIGLAIIQVGGLLTVMVQTRRHAQATAGVMGDVRDQVKNGHTGTNLRDDIDGIRDGIIAIHGTIGDLHRALSDVHGELRDGRDADRQLAERIDALERGRE